VRILAIERDVPGVPDDAFTQDLLREEAERVWTLECGDGTEAEAHLATLPLVSRGLIRFDVFPLRAYNGLARLFRA
jgi:hypothetical protein